MVLPWERRSPAVDVGEVTATAEGTLRLRKKGTTHTSQRPTITASTTELFREKSTS
jgi:hypothetical protein